MHKASNSINKAIIAALGTLLFFFLVFSSLNVVIFDSNFYELEFSKVGTYEKFGAQQANYQKNILLDYFNNGDEKIHSDFYNEREKQHLVDVKNLVFYSKLIFYSLFALLFALFLLIFLNCRENFLKYTSRIFILAGTTSIIFILLAAFFAYFFQNSFSEIFYNFHLIFFNNDLWLLNPMTDNLINLFPEQFFYDCTQKIVSLLLIYGILCVLIGLLAERNNKIILFFLRHQKH